MSESALVDRCTHHRKKRFILVACPICGEDWREQFAAGEHTHRDVREHFLEDHSAGDVGETVHSGSSRGRPVTDGGRYVLPSPGSRVVEEGGRDELIVVDTHPTVRAADYEIDSYGVTVADQYDCDADAGIVEVANATAVSAVLDGWESPADLRKAARFGSVSTYPLPADKVTRGPGGGRP